MSITTFTPPSAESILQQLLNNYSAIATSNGYNISVAPGSEVYIRFSAIAQQQAVLYQITASQIDARMPDTATGSDLDRVLNQFGLVRKPATSAQGYIQLIGSAPQTLTAGMLLNGPNGLQYQVTISGVYQPASLALANTGTINTSYVPVAAVNQGSNTDLGTGEVMTWINITSLMQSTAPVVIALTGGSDLETDTQARFRLYQTLQNPPNAGNAQFLINLASNIDPIIQSGFVYPDFNGAGSQMITLMGYQSDGYYVGRDIPHLLTDNAVGGVSPYNAYSLNSGTNLVNDTSAILGNLPAVVANQYSTAINTVNNIPTNYTFLFNLPYPIGNPVNGLGGGWINNYGQTWPVPPLNQSAFCQVIAVTSPTQITITSQSITTGVDITFDPIPGLTAINWIDRSGAANNGWRIVQSVVTSIVSKGIIGGIHNYNVTLSVPLVCGILASGQTDFYGNTGIAVGDYIFPASVNAQNYLNTIMNSYAQLGPGQVTNSPTLTSLGAARTPSTQSIYSPILGTQFLQALTQNNSELISAQQNAISSPIVSLSLTNNVPPTSQPPSIFIPMNLGWYDVQR